MVSFDLQSKFAPTGDQPQAIEKLTEGVFDGIRTQVLRGVTGSGKTFTMANIIKNVGRPTLVIAHNKTLAAQLCNEFREFFPHNRVEYFVSYYDYYQPESYIPSTDTYIEKDLALNDEIDKLRNSTTCSLGEREDVIVVASVSCIYGLGAPEEYFKLAISLRPGDTIEPDALMRKLVEIQYARRDIDFKRASFRVNGDILEIFPAWNSEVAIRVEFFGDEIERLSEVDVVTGKIVNDLKHAVIFPASHYAVGTETLKSALSVIEQDLWGEVKAFEDEGKLLEAQRLKQRTLHDLEMLREIGYCSGVENYSRYFDGRSPGMPSFTLLDYFPKGNFLTFIDESHMTIPQIRAMYHGDYSRKKNLVDYGFRMKSAYDNRPLTFEEFDERIPQMICVSATPADYELSEAGQVVEQLIRPTGLLDPLVLVRPTKGQIDDILSEIHEVVEKEGGRVLITTLTKRMAESLTDYLKENGVKVRYMHSDIDTLERIDIVNGLRSGEFDVLCGINLLREGLDMPEVKLVAILDADKEGFLRSETSLVQTIGRAARNDEGRVILYADTITDSMKRAMDETERRRGVQDAYNKAHGIVPKTIVKEVKTTLSISQKPTTTDIKMKDIPAEIEKLKALMKVASSQLDFEKAIEIRNTIAQLKMKMRKNS
ncbi:MAG: excinuclease ABC subunit UvrB [Clostridia bacterium]|nr:excinuclease ABC subunit UvrB [Clostridia bacterium]